MLILLNPCGVLFRQRFDALLLFGDDLCVCHAAQCVGCGVEVGGGLGCCVQYAGEVGIDIGITGSEDGQVGLSGGVIDGAGLAGVAVVRLRL